MSELPTDFWSGWIVVLTLTSLGFIAWLIYSVYFSEVVEEESPIWDGNLSEGSNPAPMWWFWLIFTMLVISVIYLMLYPGLGSYSGFLNWTQGGRLESSYGAYEREFSDLRALVGQASVPVLQKNSVAMASAARVFDENCAACHGRDARGQAALFPDLRDGAWQWGAAEQQIEQTIRAGRTAVMPGWAAVLGDAGVAQVTDYVLALGTAENIETHPGRVAYEQICTACHGADGSGNPLLGSPNIADDIWLYGGDELSVRHSIGVGRTGVMPAFAGRLDDTQVRMLVAWLMVR
jgi:cytochrome c oxidase cbb3-type subunit 3